VQQPAFTDGNVPARSNFSVDALALMLSIDLAPGR
jgi:hypothetical protein